MPISPYDGYTAGSNWIRANQPVVVTNISALRALDKTKISYAVTKGYYTAGDGGAGEYWYDSSDTSSTDNGGTIITASDGGRWKLITFTYNVRLFGAKATVGFDDTQYIQNCINAAGVGATVYFPKGFYNINGTITKKAGQILKGDGWATVVGSYSIEGGTCLIQNSTADIPLVYCYGASDSAQVERGGLVDIALYNSTSNSTVGTGYCACNSRQELLSNVYVANFNTGILQRNSCWQWSMTNVIVMGAAFCLIASDEGEDSTYQSCIFRPYRPGGVGVKLKNMSQTSLFLGCDMSNGAWGVILEQGDTGATPYPMHASFINCQFEDNSSGCIMTSSSMHSANSSQHPSVTAIGCRAYAFSSPNSGQCFIFLQHASQIKVEQLVSSGYSYGCVIGVNGYQGASVVGSLVGPITWGNDAASTWGTSRFYGKTSSVSLVPGDAPITRLSSTALSYTSGNFTRVPFVTAVSDFSGWADVSNQGVIPARAQTVKFKASVYTVNAPIGRYSLHLYKNGSPFATIYDNYISTAGQALLMCGETFDTPNGTSDYYHVVIYATANFTVDTGAATIFVAGTVGQ